VYAGAGPDSFDCSGLTMMAWLQAGVAIHPNEAPKHADQDALTEIERLARLPEVRAVGETGLDYYREGAPATDQERAFAAHIELAREAGKALIIHTRAAEEPTLAMLRERAGGLTVIMHCFSMPERLEECLDEGWWISFAGNVTYPSARDLARAAARVPGERLLVETDAPYLSPQATRKQRNQPAFVVHTFEFLAELRGVGVPELGAAVEANAARVFGW